MTEDQSAGNKQQGPNDPTAVTGEASQGTTDGGMDPDTAASESVIVAGGGSQGGDEGGGAVGAPGSTGTPSASVGEGG
jgi:hypothetical protein